MSDPTDIRPGVRGGHFWPRPIGWGGDDTRRARRRMARHFGAMAVAMLALAATVVSGRPGGHGSTSLAVAQLGLIVVLAAAAAMTLSCARDAMLAPLIRVRQWAARIRQGDFSARLPAASSPELRGLADDINRLAEWLESLADDQERQMASREKSLVEKSRSLRLLYDVATGISETPDAERLLADFLDTLAAVVGTRSAAVYVDAGGELKRLARIGDDHPELGERPGPSLAEAGAGPAAAGWQAAGDGETRIVNIPLTFGRRVHGLYRLVVEPPFRLSDDLAELFTSLGRHLGMAVEKQRLDRESILLSRMEERARLASELHDSLAQTLAGLRFQVRVLDDLLHQDDEESIWQEMERVEGNLELANRELRELIAHFRAPIDRRGLVPALEAAVARFRSDGGLQIFFQNQWGRTRVPEEWEVQITRIVQEALSNIRRHSGAETVRILLGRSREGRLRVLIEDDGSGLSEPSPGGAGNDHFGLAIMRERAAAIGAELCIESEPGEGTRVALELAVQESAGPAAIREGAP